MRKLATWAFSFAAGIFLAQYLLPHGWQLSACLAACGLGATAYFFQNPRRLRILLIAAGLAAALSWNWAYVQTVSVPAEKLAGTEQRSLSMTVCEYASATKYGAKVTVQPRLAGLHGVRAVYYGKRSLLRLEPGNILTLKHAQLRSASRMNDEEITVFTAKGTFLMVTGRTNPSVSHGSAAAFRWLPQRTGRVLQNRIGKLFAGDAAGFLTAILTGDKSRLSAGAASDLSEAGVFHILAVSGMHCGFLLAMVVLLAGRHRRRLVAVLAVPLLAFYFLLAGGTPSVARACVMLTFLLLAPLCRREGDPTTALSAALALILIKNPFAAASVSLQLSFAAMAGMIWLTPPLMRLLSGKREDSKPVRFVIGSFSATVGALAFTVPLSAVYFNILVLAAPLSNLLCLWAASLIFCTGLLAVLAGFLWFPLGTVIGLAPRALIAYLLGVVRLIAKLPYHAVYFSNPYLKFWLALVYVLFGIAIVTKPSAPRKYLLSAVLSILTLLLTLRMDAGRYTRGKLNVTVLDVGQGECVLLSSKGHFAVIDCGSANSWKDAGELAADTLQSMGCRRLDYLLLTHYDSDHICGAEDLLHRIPTNRLLAPRAKDDGGLWKSIREEAHESNTTLHLTDRLETLTLGGAKIFVYPPMGTKDDNQRGISFRCASGGYNLLVTGDMDIPAEKQLLRAYPLPKVETLVAGHHGARTSTSDELLAALKPKRVIISVGENSYGHPTVELLRRLKRTNCRIYRTDLQGTIHLTVN